MGIAALIVAVLACVFIVVIGLRFLLAPRAATVAYGLADGDVRGLTAIKGTRDIASGVILLVVWLVAGPVVFGWALLAAALIPIGDALIVITTGGRLSTALGIHGVTAALLIAAGLVLVLA